MNSIIKSYTTGAINVIDFAYLNNVQNIFDDTFCLKSINVAILIFWCKPSTILFIVQESSYKTDGLVTWLDSVAKAQMSYAYDRAWIL